MLLNDLSPELDAITSGNPVTRDGYISRLANDGERFDKRMVNLHLCKAQAVKWTTPVPAECSMTFNEACSDENGFAVLTQLEKERLAQCPPGMGLSLASRPPNNHGQISPFGGPGGSFDHRHLGSNSASRFG